MIQFVLAVRDRAMNAYMQPMFVPAIGLALRSFADECNRPESPVYAHPDDYDLYELGQYDDETGRLTSLDTPRMVAVGKDLKRPTA